MPSTMPVPGGTLDPQYGRRCAMTEPQEVLDFWFDPESVAKHFEKDAAFDDRIRQGFGPAHAAACAGELDHWMATPDGALALVIVLDQFSRNLFRGDARAFACDPEARRIADIAIARGDDLAMPEERRKFFYLPLEHSEDLADQERCVELMTSRLESPVSHEYAEAHRRIIARFGRFPHRNAALGRESTAEELAFLQEPGSSF